MGQQEQRINGSSNNGHVEQGTDTDLEVWGNQKQSKGQPSFRARLERKWQFHQQRADALRIALEILDEDLGESKRASGQSVLRQAMAIDSARRAGNLPTAQRDNSFAMIRERRKKTAALLATLSRTKPQHLNSGAGVLVQSGYIVRKGDGYVRTSKPFEADPSKAMQQSRNRRKDKGNTPTDTRHRTAKFLATLSTTKPTPLEKIDYGGLPILQHTGYIVKKGDGYVKTGKEFIP